jgi:SAM-dependent methyltransferase
LLDCNDAYMTSHPSHCAVCNIGDFADLELHTLMREAFATRILRYGSKFPTGVEHRKYWEVAMALRALRDLGAMSPETEALGVGAGAEATLFWLTNHVSRVFATDLYLDAGTWEEVASPGMLVDASSYATCRWNPRRLVVQNMNALDLRYEDCSFDAIFSSSSIEHFGTFEDVRAAAREMHRVLRPGGVLSLSTEFRIRGEGQRIGGTLTFSEAELRSTIIDGLSWELASPLDTTISSDTASVIVPFAEAVEDMQVNRDWSRYPHILLEHDAIVWTSVHVALRKSV